MNNVRFRVVIMCGVTLFACIANAKDAPRVDAKTWKSHTELVAASPASDWRDVAPDDLIAMDLPQGQVLVELAPRFAPEHVANIRTLVPQ